jgi:hypothetical protein
MTGRALSILVAVVAAILLLAAAWGYLSTRGWGENGSGFNYRGEFYLMSSAEVRADWLGPLLDRDVPFRDTVTDVRAIEGVAADVGVAAKVHDFGGTPAENGVAWLVMSPDPDIVANPWSHPALTTALHPPW